MKKIFVTMMLLMAALGAKAQMTPEAWIASLPSLPSINQIIAEDRDYRYPFNDDKDVKVPTADFQESVEAAMKSGSEMMRKVGEGELLHQKNVAFKEKVPGTNVTKGQMAHMSKSQQEKVAKQAVKGQLAQYGLSEADIKKMQSGKMTKAEQDALTNKMMKQMTGGMTMDDVNKMQGMTDKQRAEYMQETGLAESTSAKMAADKKKKKVSQATLAHLQKVIKERDFTTQRVIEHKELSHVVAFGDSLWNHKYEATAASLRKKQAKLAAKLEGLWHDAANGKNVEAEIKAVDEQGRQNQLNIWENENKFYAEYIPLYHRALGGMLDYIKGTVMSAYRNWKNVYDKAYKETGEQQWMLGEVQITQPVDFYAGFLGAIGNYNINTKGHEFHLDPESFKDEPDLPYDPVKFNDARNNRDTDGNPYDSYEE